MNGSHGDSLGGIPGRPTEVHVHNRAISRYMDREIETEEQRERQRTRESKQTLKRLVASSYSSALTY